MSKTAWVNRANYEAWINGEDGAVPPFLWEKESRHADMALVPVGRERDHEAMEKLRALPGSWVVYVDTPVFGRVASLQRISPERAAKLRRSKVYDDPADAILGGSDE